MKINGSLTGGLSSIEVDVEVPGYGQLPRRHKGLSDDEIRGLQERIESVSSVEEAGELEVRLLARTLGRLLWPASEAVPGLEEGETLQIRLTTSPDFDKFPWELAVLPEACRPELTPRGANDRSNFHIVRRRRPSETLGPRPAFSGGQRPLRVAYVFLFAPYSTTAKRSREREEKVLRTLERQGVEVRRHPVDELFTVQALHALADGSDVVWFAAHGTAGNKPGIEVTDGKDAAVLGASDLTLALQDADVRVVAVAACKMAHAPRFGVFGSLARDVFERSGVPLVIAPTRDLSDDAGEIMLESILSALAEGAPVETIITRARQDLRNRGRVGEHGSVAFFSSVTNGPILGDRVESPSLTSDSASRFQFAQFRTKSGEHIRWMLGATLRAEAPTEATMSVAPCEDPLVSLAVSPSGRVAVDVRRGSLQLLLFDRHSERAHRWGQAVSLSGDGLTALAVADPPYGSASCVDAVLAVDGVTRRVRVLGDASPQATSVEVRQEWEGEARFAVMTGSSTLIVMESGASHGSGTELEFLDRSLSVALAGPAKCELLALDLALRHGVLFGLIGTSQNVTVVSDLGAEREIDVINAGARLVRDASRTEDRAAFVVVPESSANAGQIHKILPR